MSDAAPVLAAVPMSDEAARLSLGLTALPHKLLLLDIVCAAAAPVASTAALGAWAGSVTSARFDCRFALTLLQP